MVHFPSRSDQKNYIEIFAVFHMWRCNQPLAYNKALETLQFCINLVKKGQYDALIGSAKSKFMPSDTHRKPANLIFPRQSATFRYSETAWLYHSSSKDSRLKSFRYPKDLPLDGSSHGIVLTPWFFLYSKTAYTSNLMQDNLAIFLWSQAACWIFVFLSETSDHFWSATSHWCD